MRVRAVVGDQKLRNQLKSITKQSKREHDGEVLVGYTQNYAIYVHEKRMHHEVGSWKYLQKAYEEERLGLMETIRTATNNTGSLKHSLLIAGLRIQRTSQKKYCPVDTGALKNSAWTAYEEDAGQEAESAKRKGEQTKRKSKT